MATTTIRVTSESRDKVRILSEQTGLKQQEVIDQAVEAFRRQVFLDAANSAFANLNSNEARVTAEHAERQEWDDTLNDGLRDEG
jgi:predicted transcriptional regulator